MRHTVVDRWSLGTSPLHTRDPRAKLAVFLAMLVAIATSRSQLAFAAYASVMIAAVAAAALPLFRVLLRAALVLPFTIVFALAAWDASIVERTYLSGLAAVLFVSTTPLPQWAAGLHAWHVPRTLVLTIQFLYRYLFVLAEQAQRMRWAARMRGGSSYAVGVLFARSWEYAAGIERAMRARQFTGRFPLAVLPRWRGADVLFTALGVAVAFGIRVAA